MPDCTDIFKVEPRLDVFLIGGVGVTIVSVFGIVGNVLTILVLTRPHMKSSTSTLLSGLSVCDLIFVTCSCIRIGFPVLFIYLKIWREFITTVLPVIIGLIVSIRDTSLFGSVYFTVAVSVERFIVVSFPLRARTYCTMKNAVRTSVVITILAVLFKLHLWVGLVFLTSYEDRYVNGTWVCYQRTNPAFLRNPNYRLYYANGANFFVYRLIPFTLLCVLNCGIYKKVREANLSRQTMTQSESNETSVARMLLVVVLAFLACNSFHIVIRLREAIFEGGEKNTPKIYGSIGDFLLNLNSAVNFIIYCMMGEKFRRTCIHFLCPRSMPRTGWDNSIRTNSTSISNPIPLTTATEISNQRRLCGDTESISVRTATTATTI